MSRPLDYWCSRRLLVTIEGPQGKSEIPLARPFARIGRQAGSDIVLGSPWVAKRSLFLLAIDEGVFCFYMQPEETNSQRLGYWLGPGEPLMVGPYRISARLEGDEPGAAPALVPLDEWGSAAGPCPVFQVYSGGKLRDKRRFRARLNLIGRRHECALQVKGQQVSSFHGCLYWQYPRLWYIDLVSSNGSSVNGQKVDCAELRIGDHLDIGEFTLHFQRLSRGGSPRSEPPHEMPTAHGHADMLPPDFEDDMPLDFDGSGAVALDESLPSEVSGSAPVIPLEVPCASSPAPTQRALAPPQVEPETPQPADAPPANASLANATALAPIQQTRQELAVLEKRVEELTQAAAKAGKSAAQQLAVKTREALQRQRHEIVQELERRSGELAQEKLALEAQFQSASRELATQVSQLRDEASLLAQQRQAMEQSRLMWDAQRAELERQLLAYAQQLHRLEHATGPGLPAPTAAQQPPGSNGSPPAASVPRTVNATVPPAASPIPRLGPPAEGENIQTSEVATSLALASFQQPGALAPRSHIVDASVAGAEPPGADVPGLPAGEFRPTGLPPGPTFQSDDGGQFLEGSVGSAAIAVTPSVADSAAPRDRAVPNWTVIGRKSSKGKEVFGLVTDRLVQIDQERRRMMVILGVVGSVAVIALAAALIVAAVLWR